MPKEIIIPISVTYTGYAAFDVKSLAELFVSLKFCITSSINLSLFFEIFISFVPFIVY